MKRIGIMQAYFMPYIGYFQLINAVDEFIIYDNIQYTKKGWINRNRILQGDKDKYITLPLQKDSDFLNICERNLADSFNPDKLMRQIETTYHKAPYYEEISGRLEDIIYFDNHNLFQYIFHSVKEVCQYLDIMTPIIVSSEMHYDSSLKGQDKVIAICKERECCSYINSIGGINLYSAKEFAKENIQLYFIKTIIQEYPQFKNVFVPALSIIDVLVFNSKLQVKKMLLDYNLVEGNS